MDCDLIMSIGSRWDDRITGKLSEFCVDATKIHVDIDVAEINKIVRPDVSLAGDAKLTIEDLLPLCGELDTADWLKEIDEWRKQFPLKYAKRGGLRAQHVIDGWTRSAGATASSPPTWASTRCGRRSSTAPTKNPLAVVRAAPAPWASASRPPSARSSPGRTTRSGASSATAASR